MLKNWAACRFDCRKQAISRPLKAISRGPACPVGKPGGNSPQVDEPQDAVQSVSLILGYRLSDLGQFQDLMLQRCGVAA
jgi:hypothetical protein